MSEMDAVFYRVKIEGLCHVGGEPRLFVITPEGKRREIARIDFADKDENGDLKYQAYIAPSASAGATK